MSNSPNYVDPGILEILGAIAEVLGVADHIQRILPLGRWRVARRHRRIGRLLTEFDKRIGDARAALRVLSTAVDEHLMDAPNDSVGFAIPGSELPIFRRGIDQLHVAIRAMTNLVCDLEAITTGIADEQERFYKISEYGREVLDALRRTINGDVKSIPSLLKTVDRFLVKCSTSIAERDQWRDESDYGSGGPDRHNAGQAYEPWSEDEDQELCDGFDSGLSIPQLSEKHQRSRGAIRSRLKKLGKINQ